MSNSIFLELSSEVCTCEFATIVTPDVLQSFWSEGLAVQVLLKIAFDVCSPLLVHVWSFTFVLHEVHPREVGEVVHDHHPVLVTFSGCWSDWSSHICYDRFFSPVGTEQKQFGGQRDLDYSTLRVW